MKILLLTSSYPIDERDGTAPFIRSIARALAHRGHEVRVLVPERAGAPARSQELGITVRWLRYAPHCRLRVIGHAQSLQNDMRVRPIVLLALPFFWLAQFSTGLRECREWKPDVIHAHWVIPSGLVGAALSVLCRTPLIISTHGSDVYVASRNRLARPAVHWALTQATAITSPSADLRTGVIALGANPRQAHILPYGVDTMQFKPASENQVITPPIVLAVGRLVPKKGFEVLLRAAPAILSAIPDARIWIAGGGELQANLQAIRSSIPSKTAERITLLGAVNWCDVAPLLQRATVFTAPSITDPAGNQDGLPNTILEAMSCGIPVVASDIAGIPLVIHHGENGLLVPPGDPIALSAAVIQLLRDPGLRERMGTNGRMLAVRDFNWDVIAGKLERLYPPAESA